MVLNLFIALPFLSILRHSQLAFLPSVLILVTTKESQAQKGKVKAEDQATHVLLGELFRLFGLPGLFPLLSSSLLLAKALLLLQC